MSVVCFRINFVAEKYSSKDSVDFEQERIGTRLINYANIQPVDSQGLQNMDELEKTLNDTLTETITTARPRTSTTNSEYDIIEIETDLKYNSKGCNHSKDIKTCNDSRKHNRSLENENTDVTLSDTCNGGLQSLTGSKISTKQNFPACDISIKGFSDAKLETQDDSEEEDITNENGVSASSHFDNLTETNSQNCDSVNKRCNSSGKLIGISEVFEPHADYSINEVSSDLIEEVNVRVNDSDQQISDSSMLDTENIENKTLSYQASNWRHHTKKRLEGDSDFMAFKNEMRCSMENIRISDPEKLKEHVEPVNGLWQRDNNLSSSTTERSSDEETRHRRIRYTIFAC